MKKCVYLDNAASMVPDDSVLELFSGYSRDFYANPESEHTSGLDCSMAVSEAGRKAALALTGSRDYDLIWASSATEAMNMVLSCREIIGRHVLVSRAEHPAFSGTLGRFAAETRQVGIRRDGAVDLEQLAEKCTGETTAMAVHHVQNETGALQDLKVISNTLRKRSPGSLLIVDSVQSACKLPVPFIEAGINIAFVGGHKIGFPSGGAAVFRFDSERQKAALRAHIAVLRSKQHSIGRVEPPVALCLSEAVCHACDKLAGRLGQAKKLNSLLRKKLAESGLDVRFLIPAELASPYIASVMLPGYHAQILVRMLSERGVMVSAGSACEAASKEVSETLIALGLPSRDARSVLRVSFGFQSSKGDITALIETLHEVVRDF